MVVLTILTIKHTGKPMGLSHRSGAKKCLGLQSHDSAGRQPREC